MPAHDVQAMDGGHMDRECHEDKQSFILSPFFRPPEVFTPASPHLVEASYPQNQ